MIIGLTGGIGSGKSSAANFGSIGLFSVLYRNVRISLMEFADGEIELEFSTA